MLVTTLACALAPAIGFQTAPDRVFPPLEELERAEGTAEYALWRQRIEARSHHRLGEGLSQRASWILDRAALEAAGRSGDEAAEALLDGPRRAFPYTVYPDLATKGAPRTLTILVDFKDHRAAVELPGLDAPEFQANIYGSGTPQAGGFEPYESARNYYQRASDGAFDLVGDVLDWVHLPKDRSEYGPAKSTGRVGQVELDNRALFELATEALDSFDTQNFDFTPYDNDNDGDIDLLVILYAGAPVGWEDFWWAYQWEFYEDIAANRSFGGKYLKQFVFQHIEVRGAPGPKGERDFDPRTLIHELGHALGLADYYDYEPKVGPPGGIGGLDIMGQRMHGNHGAFSRWLLGWHDPLVVGSGAPRKVELLASGANENGTKAVAVFPGLASSAAPERELFLVENRHRVGNDARLAKMPADGLLIWHLATEVDTAGDGFAFDNSETTPKLIQLLRACCDDDFARGEWAGAGAYFGEGDELGPTTKPDSNDHRDVPTGVVVRDIGPPGPRVSVELGILPSKPGPDVAQAGPRPGVEQASAGVELDGAARVLDELLAPKESLGPASVLELLLELDRQLERASASEIENLRARVGEFAPRGDGAGIALQVLCSRWASKQGGGRTAAAAAIEWEASLGSEGLLTTTLESWSVNEPIAAGDWHLARAAGPSVDFDRDVGSPRFYRNVVEAQALRNPGRVVETLESVRGTGSMFGALSGLRAVSERTGMDWQARWLPELDRQGEVLRELESLRQRIERVEIGFERVDGLIRRVEGLLGPTPPR